MTRFWISLEHAVEVVVKALMHMQGGEIFVPKIPSMKIVDLAAAIAPECEVKIIGIRPGEKLHEALITEEDGRSTVECDGLYVILPQFSWWQRQNYKDANELPEGFSYTSNNNDRWLTLSQLKSMAQEFSTPPGKTKTSKSLQATPQHKKSRIRNVKPAAISSVRHPDVPNNIVT